MVSFTAEDHGRVASGEITVTWRLWKYPHVKPGKVYASYFGGSLEIEDVQAVRAADVTDADAQQVGQPDAAALLALAASHTGRSIDAETVLYRVQFRYSPVAPEKPALAFDEIERRLQRLDGASRWGAWTVPVLRLIEENPGVVARLLAPETGMPLPDFKLNVRKLKALGLTISLERGYELSELGQSYLDTFED
ncbi:MAG TPA: hypothetical protein VG845_08610 [Dehalococcoidia bacterium]|nr:hypothetical protein [Dehalococcoidia bacterium]